MERLERSHLAAQQQQQPAAGSTDCPINIDIILYSRNGSTATSGSSKTMTRLQSGKCQGDISDHEEDNETPK